MKNENQFKLEKFKPELKNKVEVESQRRGRKSKYNWNRLRPGLSFVIPNVGIESISPLVTYARKTTGKNLHSRTETHGVRVYELEQSAS